MLAEARQHAIDRVQFGRSVASFQSIRHKLAESLVQIEGAASVAGICLENPDPLLAALAKSLAGQAARTTATHAQQVMAGIGFTAEHRFHLWLKRMLVIDTLFGSAARSPRKSANTCYRGEPHPASSNSESLGGNMGRDDYASYAKSWSAPDYTVDDHGKVVGGYVPEGSNNWGRWGDDDQRGTQNLIGPDQRVRAASLVQSGKVFSLALPIDANGPRFHTRPAPLHWFLMTGSDQVVGSPIARLIPTSSGTTTCSRCPSRAPPSGMASPT